MYFFAIEDCEDRARADDDNLDFNVDLWVKNGDSHFSLEEQGMIFYYISAFFLFVAVLGVNTYNYITDLIKHNKPDTPMLLLTMSSTL